jgi:hypothetical protein
MLPHFLTLETTLEGLLSMETVLNDIPPPPAQAKYHKQEITRDFEMEVEEDQEDLEPTPRPRKNKNRSSSSEETDLREDEHFKTPRTLKQKRIAEIIEIDSSELSELSGEESELEEKKARKKTTMGVKGKDYDQSSKVTINLTSGLSTLKNLFPLCRVRNWRSLMTSAIRKSRVARKRVFAYTE